jgi:uncharacterized cupredoxin-like copper-binding protein
MQVSIQRQHATMLLKYSGISFISGAVNHGFFSGERSFWTAAIGIVLFVAGALAEHRLADAGPEDPAGPVWRTLLWGTLLSIGLGFFTGGLQHFPDSPARSAWVVPLGYVISAVALIAQERVTASWRLAATTVTAGVLITLGSAGAWQWFERAGSGFAGHGHGEPPVVAQVVSRTVQVRMLDTMRFEPSELRVAAGETLKLAVRNDGQLPHELVIGTEREIREHAEAMRTGAPHAHGHAGAAAIELPAGGAGELVVTFREPGVLQIACLVPGHHESGMRGTLTVGPPGSSPATAAPAHAAPAPAAAAPEPAARPAREPAHGHSPGIRPHKH